jgi:urocanate hydratase
MGGMGGAQPLAATMNGACFLGIDVDPARIEKRIEDRLLRPHRCGSRRSARHAANEAPGGERSPWAWWAIAPTCLPELVRRGIVPDMLTDQTSAHDPLNGYVPNGTPLEQAALLRARSGRIRQALHRCHGRARGSHAGAAAHAARSLSITATTSARKRRRRGVADAFDIPGFVPEYIRPLFCEGRGPFRWVALSGEPRRHLPHRSPGAELFPHNPGWRAGFRWRGAHPFPGPARAHLLAGLWRARRVRLAMNASGAARRTEAPIVIGRDHLDCGSVASPFRETEAMRDGSDAIADWPC